MFIVIVNEILVDLKEKKLNMWKGEVGTNLKMN